MTKSKSRAVNAWIYADVLKIVEANLAQSEFHAEHSVRKTLLRLEHAFRMAGDENASVDEILGLKRARGGAESTLQRHADRIIAGFVEAELMSGRGKHKADGGAFAVVAERLSRGDLAIPSGLSRQAKHKTPSAIETAYKRHLERLRQTQKNIT